MKEVEAPQCNICGKIFNDKRNLVSHEKFHTNVKPFQCNFCDKRCKIVFGVGRFRSVEVVF